MTLKSVLQNAARIPKIHARHQPQVRIAIIRMQALGTAQAVDHAQMAILVEAITTANPQEPVLIIVVIQRNAVLNAVRQTNTNALHHRPLRIVNTRMLMNGLALVVPPAHLDIIAQAGNAKRIMLLILLLESYAAYVTAVSQL